MSKWVSKRVMNKKKRTPKTIKNIVKENKKKTKSNLVRD